jgi:parallel beta-helix repeat protein
VVRGASDAGIYVGQSTDVVVRRNRVEGNVAGIEIENCLRADVYDNDATGNTGGILVFSLPDLPQGQGAVCRVFGNRIVANNHANFAEEGNIVGLVPAGTGMMIMAYDQVEVFDNVFQDNQTVNLAIASYEITEYEWFDPNFVPQSRAIHVHDNTFTGGGDKPDGLRWILLSTLLGGRFPDIGYVAPSAPAAANTEAGTAASISIHDNGDADYVSIVLQTIPRFQRDAAPYAPPLDPLPAVAWEGLE